MDIVEYIINNINYEQSVSFEFEGVHVEYINEGNIPYILVIPPNIEDGSVISFEANNLETENNQELLISAINTAYRLFKNTNSIVVVPLIKSKKNEPYYQQLSKECFELPSNHPMFRFDMQIVDIINQVKNRIFKLSGIIVSDKIFLNGYSASGVFAQRFSLLHPDIVDTACIGGASGSIPVISDILDYPLGIKDFSKIAGLSFDIDNYKKIKFRYYVGELEDTRKSLDRYDDNGNYAPMHDMSYFNRSVLVDIGKIQRKLFGNNLLLRSQNIINYLQNKGIDISQTIFLGRSHNNESGIGVNELGDEFISKTYKEIYHLNKFIK